MITLQNISLRRGPRLLLEDVNLTLTAGQKVGLVGANGSGKSSLFAVLLGKLEADGGEIEKPAQLKIAHLEQEVPDTEQSALEYVLDGDYELKTTQQRLAQAEIEGDYLALAELHQVLLDIDAYGAPSRAAQVLVGLGFSQAELEQPVRAFSGGWRMRLNLARTLLSRADLLLLDEPTNHLDFDAIVWLEQWLKQFSGTVLLIAHDREFLDATTSHIWHLERQHITPYTGNYSAFETLRAQRLALQQAQYEKQQQKIQHMMAYVNRFRYKASKARQAQSRLKALARLEIVAQVQADSEFQFHFFEPKICSYPLLSLQRIKLGYPGKILFEKIDFNIAPQARIGLLGANGAGKSTFMKGLAGLLEPLAGEKIGHSNLKIGYLAQHQLEYLRGDKSPVEHLQELSPTASEQQLRNFIGGFGFDRERALTPILNFSGGEKTRLALALLVWQKPNLLLLDEPTNHLDLEMRNALNLALQTYEGAVVIVSHDRYLLRTTIDEYYWLADGQLRKIETLEEYEQHLAAQNKAAASISMNVEIKPNIKQEQQKQKRQLEKQVQESERKFQQLQNQLQELDARLAEDSLYSADKQTQLKQLLQERKVLVQRVSEAESVWFAVCAELEQIDLKS